MHIKNYLLFVTLLFPSMSITMDNKDILSHAWSQDLAKKIANNLHNHIQQYMKPGLEKIEPQDVSTQVVNYVDALHVSEKQADDISDEYLKLLRLRYVIRTTTKFVACKLSQDGARLALAEENGDNVDLAVMSKDNNGWKEEWTFGGIHNLRLRTLESIVWDKAGSFYTIHGGDTSYALEWEQSRHGKYSTSVRHTPSAWDEFYKEHNIVDVKFSKGPRIQKIDDKNIAIMTQVSSEDELQSYLKQECKQRVLARAGSQKK